MKKILSILILLTLIVVVPKTALRAQMGNNASQIQIPNNGSGGTYKCGIILPASYSSSPTTKYPVWFFFHGSGEGGANLSSIYTSSNAGGPAYYNAQGQWPGSFVSPLDGHTYEPIVVYPQFPGTGSTSATAWNYMIEYMVANYRVDTTMMAGIGISAGGTAIIQYGTKEGNTPRHTMAAMIPLSASIGQPTQPFINAMIADSSGWWGIGSMTDGLGISTRCYIEGAFSGNCGSVTGLPAYMRHFTTYSGGHCCWNQFLNPTYKENVNGTMMSLYEWILTWDRKRLIGGNQRPVANAGTNKIIYSPTTSVTLAGTGTDADGTIATYAWTQTSGTAATIVSPAAATTSITGLSTAGIRTFKLKVTDNGGASDSSTVTVTVNASNTAPTATTTGNKVVNLPTASVLLSGSGTDVDGTIASYAWTQTGGTAATILHASSDTTTITGLSTEGVRTFLLTVTDNGGATGTASLTVTVNASGAQGTINVNLYGTASYINAAWNNWQVTGSLTKSNLAYDDGTVSGIGAVLSTQTSYSDNGGSYPVTMCPQAVGRDASYHTATRTLTLTGLDNAKVYDLKFYASRNNAGQTTRFTVGGVNRDIATHNNYTSIASYTSVSPSAGSIVVTIAALVNYNYLNGFTLVEKEGSGNQAPVADAGPAQGLVLPASTVTLTGSATDADGTISSYLWEQIAGTAATIASPASATTDITGLTTAGIRTFQLTATDNGGATSVSTTTVTVNPQSSAPNITIISPGTVATNSATISASIVSDFPIAATTWTKFKSPGNTSKKVTVAGSSTWAGTGATVPDSSITNMFKAYYKSVGLLDTLYNLAVGGSDVFSMNITTTLNYGSPILILSYPSNTYSTSNFTQSMARFREIRDSCTNRGVQLFVSGIQPRDDYNSAGRGNLLRLNDSLIALFGYRYGNIFQPVTDLIDTTRKAEYRYNVDGIHLNNAGHKVLLGIMKALNVFQNTSTSSATIQTPTILSTDITGLALGTHQFQVSMVDNRGFAASDVGTVIVTSTNQIPTANAGTNKTITLPTSTVTLTGSGTDADGTVASYGWTQISGNIGVITSPGNATTTITGMNTQGTRVFRLTVIDNEGAIATSDVSVTVLPAALTVTQIGVGEYNTTAMTADGGIYTTVWGGFVGVSRDTTIRLPIANVKETQGGQYVSVIRAGNAPLDTVMNIYKDNFNGGQYGIAKFPRDSLGNLFNNVQKIYGWFQCDLAIKGDSIYYWGADSLSYGALRLKGLHSAITKPFKLNQPPGRAVADIVIGDQDVPSFIARCTDGTVWKYTQGSATPTQVLGFPTSDPILKIGGISLDCYIAVTANNIYAWGQYTSVVGLPDNTTTPTSILAPLQAVGLTMPLKEIGNNSNLLAVIDANNSLFTWGDSPMGEAGNGIEINPYRLAPGPFAWSFARFQKMVPPYKHRGQFKNLCTSGNIAFYLYAQDLHDKWYSWGRSKTGALMNGYIISNENIYPCSRDIPAPRTVYPLGVVWPANGGPLFDPNVALPPVANAGTDRDITAATDSIYGDLSSQQEQTITSYAWVQLLGPSQTTIESPGSANTKISGYISGTYTYELTVTNSNGLINKDTVTHYMTLGIAPTADAGLNQTIYAPATSVTVSGTGTPASGTTITGYAWTQLSGNSATIQTPALATTSITGLVPGVYSFQLLVTGSNGLTATSIVTITVSAQPTINAGVNQVIHVPASSVTLSGTTNISSPTLSWTQVSGPGSYSLVSPNSLTTNVTNLVPGTYQFRFYATGANGAMGADTVQVIVNQPPVIVLTSSRSIVSPDDSIHAASSSTDVDGTVASYVWVQSSGTTATITGGTTATPTITGLTAAGVRTFTLTVTDNLGGTSTAILTVTVYASAPPAIKTSFQLRIYLVPR